MSSNLNTELLKEKENLILDFLLYWNRPIRAGDLVKELDIKHSTLNSVLHRLSDQELVDWQSYGPVQLTEKGIEQATHLSNHHFIVEKFLKESLNLTPEQAHMEAIHLAGAISCNLIEAICKKLNLSHEQNNQRLCLERKYHAFDNHNESVNESVH